MRGRAAQACPGRPAAAPAAPVRGGAGGRCPGGCPGRRHGVHRRLNRRARRASGERLGQRFQGLRVRPTQRARRRFCKPLDAALVRRLAPGYRAQGLTPDLARLGAGSASCWTRR